VKSNRWLRDLLANEWIVAVLGGLAVTVASAYIIAFSGLGGSQGTRSLPRPQLAKTLDEYVSVYELPAKEHSSFYISISNATPQVGVNVDIYSASGQQVDGTFIRANSQGKASDTYPWPLNSEQPQPGVWKIVAHNTDGGATVSAYIQVL
jgi:hypothetical protein